MRVGVDDAGHDILARAVEDFSAIGRRNALAQLPDLAVVHPDGAVLDGTAGHSQDSGVANDQIARGWRRIGRAAYRRDAIRRDGRPRGGGRLDRSGGGGRLRVVEAAVDDDGPGASFFGKRIAVE